MRADCAGEFPETRPLLPLPAHGGRSVGFTRAVCEADGRLELPKPWGARPESVALPWAFHERPDVEGREPLLLKEAGGRELFVLRLTALFVCEEKLAGGRFAESCDCRAPFVPFAPRPKLPGELLPARLPEKLEEFNARDGKCEAAAAGVERVTTLRFWTLAEGVAMWPFRLAAP